MKKSTFVFATVAASLLLTGVVSAQRSAAMEQKWQRVNRCNVIQGNVDKRLKNFETKRLKHNEQYEKMYDHVSDLVTKMENEGYDVSQPKIDLVQLKSLIAKYNSDYALYLGDLRDTKEFTCGRSEGEFKAKLGIARTQLKVVHDDSVAVRTFWAKTIKPELVGLKTETTTATVEGGTR